MAVARCSRTWRASDPPSWPGRWAQTHGRWASCHFTPDGPSGVDAKSMLGPRLCRALDSSKFGASRLARGGKLNNLKMGRQCAWCTPPPRSGDASRAFVTQCSAHTSPPRALPCTCMTTITHYPPPCGVGRHDRPHMAAEALQRQGDLGSRTSRCAAPTRTLSPLPPPYAL